MLKSEWAFLSSPLLKPGFSRNSFEALKKKYDHGRSGESSSSSRRKNYISSKKSMKNRSKLVVNSIEEVENLPSTMTEKDMAKSFNLPNENSSLNKVAIQDLRLISGVSLKKEAQKASGPIPSNPNLFSSKPLSPVYSDQLAPPSVAISKTTPSREQVILFLLIQILLQPSLLRELETKEIAKKNSFKTKLISKSNPDFLEEICSQIQAPSKMNLQRGTPVHTPIDPSQKKEKADFVFPFSVSSEEIDQVEKPYELEKQRSKEPIEVDLNALFQCEEEPEVEQQALDR
ncbi:uncharacterized protein E5676_scaffold216G00470 [Cucumis melo var. makuwa]|uniref:Uncharacterized protein n=1 Tax=Cucumis melo var. makuwa TaxID=1194695 RepID=A0A5D3E2G1_CUCMM|nr:uncharacterized protein E5676_scaffold216G00470 [Cucumis melo var. makuwa]